MQKAANACASLRNWQSLRHRAAFLRLQKNGQKWITPYFVIQLSFPNSNESDTHSPDADFQANLPQIGFTATKKIGNAVIRNRCRRRLRAVCDAITPEFALNGVQFVLIARTGLQDYDYTQLTRDLRWALRRLNVPQNTPQNKHVKNASDRKTDSGDKQSNTDDKIEKLA